MVKRALYFTIISYMFIMIGCSHSIDAEESLEGESNRTAIDSSQSGLAPVVEMDTTKADFPAEITYGTFNFSGIIPSSTAKIPNCTDGVPKLVQFDMVDSLGTRWLSEKPVVEQKGVFMSEVDSMPIGNYTIKHINLLSAERDTLYGVPTKADTDIIDYVEGEVPAYAQTPMADYLDTVLPLSITISEENTVIEATAFCNTVLDLPVPDSLGGGINTGELMTIPIYITGIEDKGGFTNEEGVYEPYMDLCADYFTVTIDGYRVPERYTWSQFNQYHITVPSDYDYMSIRTYDLDGSPNGIQAIQFTRENPYDAEIHGALVFDQCDPQSQDPIN